MKNRRIMTPIVTVILLLSLLASCGSTENKIVLASKPMTEQFILAEMLIAVIEQETDLSVEHKAGIGGGTSNIHPALVSGEIDLYPEYTGTGWMFVLEEELINDPERLYQEVKSAYEDQFEVVWSNLYGFNDTFGLAMKREVAQAYNIKTYSDLAKLSDQFTIGAEHDFFERDDGFIGIDQVYDFEFKKEVGMDIGLKYQAIDSDEVDVINIFSTDGRLQEYDLLVLEDDQYFFPSYDAATLIRQETLNTYPELSEAIGLLDGQISNEEMTYMNYLVSVEKEEAAIVARDFLQEKGLLRE